MDLDDKARMILEANDQGYFTTPKVGQYPYQWNWDSVLIAVALSTFNPERAWLELETLFSAQWPSGMVPQIVFHTEAETYFPGPAEWQANCGPIPSSGVSQPPVHATAIRRIATAEPKRAEPFLPKLNSYHEWWHTARNTTPSRAIAVFHPWEAGRDNLPDWDGPGDAIDISNVGAYQRADLSFVDPTMRPQTRDYDRYVALVQFGRERHWDDSKICAQSPFWVADPFCTAVLLRAERDLLALSEQFDCDTTDIEQRVDRLEHGLGELWNPDVGAYCSRDLRNGRFADVATSATFMAAYAGVETHLDQINSLFDAWTQTCPYGVATFDPTHSEFDPARYWRGSIWLVMNYLIGTGLDEIGDTIRGNVIRNWTRELVERSGFYEYFNPIDGSGCGGADFAFTAASWLALRSHER